MLWSRRRALAFGLATAATPAWADADLLSEQPADDPAPFAVSTAAVRYWPVVTDVSNWNVVSAELSSGAFVGEPLRCFNAPRPAAQAANPTRRHAGVDLFANAGDEVVAVEDGQLVALYPFLQAHTGEMSYALLVAHVGYVANYGEIRSTSLSARALSLGDRVSAGQAIAEISDTRQLHFETYLPGATRNQSWRNGAPRPSRVLNPTQLLMQLAATGMRLRPVAR